MGRKRGEEVGEKVVEREMLELLSGIDSNKPQISREGGWWEIHVRMDPSLIVDAGPEPQSPLLWEQSVCRFRTLHCLHETLALKGHLLYSVSECEC